MQKVRVISERTLDNKTIKLSDNKDAIEVQVSDDVDNVIKVTEEGLKVPGFEIRDLEGNIIGRLISN